MGNRRRYNNWNTNPKFRDKNVKNRKWWKTYDLDNENVRGSNFLNSSYNDLVSEYRNIDRELYIRRREIRDSKYVDKDYTISTWKTWCWVWLTVFALIACGILSKYNDNLENRNKNYSSSPIKVQVL